MPEKQTTSGTADQTVLVDGEGTQGIETRERTTNSEGVAVAYAAGRGRAVGGAGRGYPPIEGRTTIADRGKPSVTGLSGVLLVGDQQHATCL